MSDANRDGGLIPFEECCFPEARFEARCDRYTGFDPPIWEPMEISITLKEPLTDEQIDALFPPDQLGDDPRWAEAIRHMKEVNRRAREDA